MEKTYMYAESNISKLHNKFKNERDICFKSKMMDDSLLSFFLAALLSLFKDTDFYNHNLLHHMQVCVYLCVCNIVEFSFIYIHMSKIVHGIQGENHTITF